MLISLLLEALDLIVVRREELEIHLWEKFSTQVNCAMLKCFNSKLLPFRISRNIALAVFHCLSNSGDLVDEVGAAALGPTFPNVLTLYVAVLRYLGAYYVYNTFKIQWKTGCSAGSL